MFKIVYMILYSTKMRNAVRRFFWSIREAYEVIFVYALNIMVWSGFAYVLFYGKIWDLRVDMDDYFDSKKFPTYNFSNYLSSLFSMYVLQSKVNHPDIFLKVQS